MILSLIMALASCSGAVSSPDAPFFVRELKDQQDVGAINQNFRALSDYVRNMGGDVTTYVTTSGNNAFTGNNTHSGTETFYGQISLSTNAATIPSISTGAIVAGTAFPSTFGVCMTSRTVYFPSSGWGSVEVSGHVYNGGSQYCKVGFLLDHEWPYPQSATVGVLTVSVLPMGGISFSRTVYISSAGLHSVCLTGISIGGACFWGWGSGTYDSSVDFTFRRIIQ